MKIPILVGIFVLCSTAFLSGTRAEAAEIGFSASLITRYSGTVNTFENRRPAVGSSGIPLEVFVTTGNVRYGFKTYDQYIKDTYTRGNISGHCTIHFQTDVFSVNYLKTFGIIDQQLVPYTLAGLGVFQSASTSEAFLSDGSRYFSGTIQRRTSGIMNLGFLLAAGMKKTTENAFIGGEVSYINANLTYNKINNENIDKFDASGIFFSFTTGVTF